jgi:hypothetical protein
MRFIAIVALLASCAHHHAAPPIANQGHMTAPTPVLASGAMTGPYATLDEAPLSKQLDGKTKFVTASTETKDKLPQLLAAELDRWGADGLDQQCSLALQLDDGWYTSTPFACGSQTAVSWSKVWDAAIMIRAEQIDAEYTIKLHGSDQREQIDAYTLSCSIAQHPPTCTTTKR